MDSDSAFMMAYGVYLSNGGRKQDFFELTSDDIQIILSTHLAERDKQTMDLLKGIASMFGGEKIR